MNSTAEIIGGPEVFLSEVTLLADLSHTSNASHIQAAQQTVSASTNICPRYSSVDELRGYQSSIGPDFESITRLENMVGEGNALVNLLYCFRSVSRAVPEMMIAVDESKSDTERELELATKRIEISRQLSEILKPEIAKIRKLMKFTASAVDAFVNIILRLASASDKAPIVPETLLLSLLRLLDILLKIDNMKDLKASLRSDFSRYKRAVGTNLSNDELEDMKNLQEFLSSLDPRKSRNAIILTLRERLLTIRGCEGILTELLDVALDKFESDTALLLPDERFGFLRAAAHLMLLVDGDPADPKSLNVFSSKWSRQPVVLKLFKRYPVVPLYADMTITLLYILNRAPHFNRETMCETWGGAGAGIMSNIFQAAQGISAPTGAAGPTATNASGPYSTATGSAGLATSAAASAAGVRVPADYDLCAQWPGLRQSFTQYTVLLAGAINHAEAHPYRKFLDGARVQQASNLFAVLVKGLSLLSSWTSTVQLALAWKYTHPSARRVTSSTFAATTATTATAAAIPPPLQAVGESSSVRASAAAPDGAEYEQVLRNNFSREELAIFADIISMIKSTARLLARAEPLMAAYVRFYMHHRIQQVVQGDLLPILHRLDKRKKPELPSLLQIRALAADWIKGVEPADGSDYKQYSRQHGSVTAVHPVRVVSASVAQLLLLREHIRNLYHEKSSLRSKAGMFTKADLEKEDEKNFEEFFRETWSFPHVLDFTQSLAEASNLGALWFREFHLEITKCVQFPIEMSLPWIIAEHAIVSHSGDVPLMENVLFVMDIYNDAASTALHRLQQQHLYDEIEAETNLVLDQLIFLISDEAYSHFKNFSASKLLDKAFKNKLESLKGQAGTLFVGFQRYQSLITQKNVSILGRSIDLSYPVAHQVVEKLYRDVDVAIKRFEASDPCAVVELVTLLDVLRGTHAEASQYLEIESFDSIFHDVNETHLDPAETEAEAEEGADTGMGSGAVRGRVTSHMMRGLCRDLVPNFSYNAYTSRFVRSPLQLQPIEYQRAPKYSAIATAYGSICHKAYEAQDRLTNRFFGRKHIEAYMSLVGRGYADFEVIAEECMSDIQGLLTDIDAYTNVLIDGIPPCKPPKYMFRAGGCYGYYEGKLKSLLEFEELKPGVFQTFRELGNAFALLKEFSDVMVVSDQMRRVSLSPCLGLKGNETLRVAPASIREAEAFPLVRVVAEHVNNHTSAAVGGVGGGVGKQSILANASELSTLATSLGCHLWNLSVLSSSSLFSNVLARMHVMVGSIDLLRGNANNNCSDSRGDGLRASGTEMVNTQTEGGLAELDCSRSFHRLWSALTFLFCVREVNNSVNEGMDGGSGSGVGGIAEVGAMSAAYTDEEEFGHGFTFAGCILLHFLGQRTVFELSDFSRYVLNVQRHDIQGAAEQSTHASLVGKVDQSLQAEAEKFVESAVSQKYLQDHFFAFFEAQFPLSAPSAAPYTAAKEAQNGSMSAAPAATTNATSISASAARSNVDSKKRVILFRPPFGTCTNSS